MFWSKNKKNRYTPAYPIFSIMGVFIARTCFPGVNVDCRMRPMNPMTSSDLVPGFFIIIIIYLFIYMPIASISLIVFETYLQFYKIQVEEKHTCR